MNPTSAHLYAALRAGFPVELDQIAVTTSGAEPLAYTWRDLEHGSAMIANLLQSLGLEPRARVVVVQAEKSVELVMLELAVRRAGLVYEPLDTAYRTAELDLFIADAKPAVVVCSSADFGVFSKMAFRAGTGHVFTLDADRTGSLLQRAMHHPRVQTPMAGWLEWPPASS